MTIGARAQSAASGNNQQFHGWINDVAVYNYALSANQVAAIYHAGISLGPVMLTTTNLCGSQVELNWSYGTLQSGTNVSGPYNDTTNAFYHTRCQIPGGSITSGKIRAWNALFTKTHESRFEFRWPPRLPCRQPFAVNTAVNAGSKH